MTLGEIDISPVLDILVLLFSGKLNHHLIVTAVGFSRFKVPAIGKIS